MSVLDLDRVAAELSTDAVRAATDLTTSTLPNGLRLTVLEDHRLPIAAVSVWYGVGSRHEEPGRTGFAHLFEHLMFEGSRNVAPGNHMETVRSLGGAINASTSADATDYWQVFPEHATELVLWLEADRMASNREALTQERFEAQRGIVRNERRQRVDNQPLGDVGELLLERLFPEGHPYRHSVIGSMEDLDAATADDAAAFHERWYTPDNACLAIVGDVDSRQAHEWVEAFFGGIPAGGPRPAPADIDLPFDLGGVVRERLTRRIPKPQLMMAFRSPPHGSPEGDRVRLAMGALVGGRTNRLDERLVRGRELAAGLQISPGGFHHGTNMLTVQGAPRDGVSLEDLEAGVVDLLRSLVDEPITESEQARMLPQAAVAFRSMRESLNGLAGTLNANTLHADDPWRFASTYERMAAITPDEIAETFDAMVTDANRVVIEIRPEGS